MLLEGFEPRLESNHHIRAQKCKHLYLNRLLTIVIPLSHLLMLPETPITEL